MGKKIFTVFASALILTLSFFLGMTFVKSVKQEIEVRKQIRKTTSGVSVLEKSQTVEIAKQTTLSRITESDLTSNVKNSPFYYPCMHAERLYDKLTGMGASTALSGTANNPDTAEDVVVPLSNGYFTTIMDNPDINENLSKTLKFAEYVQQSGIPFIYMEVPHKLDVSDPQYIKIKDVYPDFHDANEVLIKKTFEQAGIPVVSFYDSYPEIRNNRYAYFLKTDTHWLPETGLSACIPLAEYLKENCGFSDMDSKLFEIQNYDTSLKISTLGDLGKKISMIYCEPEEMTVIKPLYDTNITVEVPTIFYKKTGAVNEVFYNFSSLADKNLYKRNGYAMYALGNPGRIKIHNNLCHNGKKLLVVKTSMANAMTPFLAAQIEYMEIIDIREFNNIKSVMKSFQPDAVVMIYGTSTFSSARAFNFK